MNIPIKKDRHLSQKDRHQFKKDDGLLIKTSFSFEKVGISPFTAFTLHVDYEG